MLYPLNIQMKDQLSNSSEEDTICADWREGEFCSNYTWALMLQRKFVLDRMV